MKLLVLFLKKKIRENIFVVLNLNFKELKIVFWASPIYHTWGLGKFIVVWNFIIIWTTSVVLPASYLLLNFWGRVQVTFILVMPGYLPQRHDSRIQEHVDLSETKNFLKADFSPSWNDIWLIWLNAEWGLIAISSQHTIQCMHANQSQSDEKTHPFSAFKYFIVRVSFSSELRYEGGNEHRISRQTFREIKVLHLHLGYVRHTSATKKKKLAKLCPCHKPNYAQPTTSVPSLADKTLSNAITEP